MTSVASRGGGVGGRPGVVLGEAGAGTPPYLTAVLGCWGEAYDGTRSDKHMVKTDWLQLN